MKITDQLVNRNVNFVNNAVFEIRGFRLSLPTNYSAGQPQLAMELSDGQPAL